MEEQSYQWLYSTEHPSQTYNVIQSISKNKQRMPFIKWETDKCSVTASNTAAPISHFQLALINSGGVTRPDGLWGLSEMPQLPICLILDQVEPSPYLRMAC